MSEPMTLLCRATSADTGGELPTWEEVLAAMVAITAGGPMKDTDELYLRILRFPGPLRLAPHSSLPHSTSPEEMLKIRAIHALGDRASPEHRLEIDRLRSEAKSPRLASAAKKYCEGCQAVTG